MRFLQPKSRKSRWRLLICIVLLSERFFGGEAAATQLHLTWQDTSPNEDGFAIERRLGMSGTFAQIAVTEANKNVFVDLGLTPETSYCYSLLLRASRCTASLSPIFPHQHPKQGSGV